RRSRRRRSCRRAARRAEPARPRRARAPACAVPRGPRGGRDRQAGTGCAPGPRARRSWVTLYEPMDDVLPTRPAGFWVRAVAFAIDAVVCTLVQMSFNALGYLLIGSAGEGSAAGPTAFFFTVIFAAAYWTTLHMVAGQTLGKSIVGVRVVSTDGALLTFGPAFLRYLASGLSLAIVGFGYLMAGLRRDKRALHDLIAGSRS